MYGGCGLTRDAFVRELYERKSLFGWRGVNEHLVHDANRGVQYASSTFTGLMEEHGIQSSMGRRGNPYDNAGCDDLPEILYQQE